MTLARRLLFGLILSSICCCAPSVIGPPFRPASGMEGETELHFLARLLSDACTSEATDEVLIDHAAALLRGCGADPAWCARSVCVRLGRVERRSVAVLP